MWMKTRVGFTALSEPLEIRTFEVAQVRQLVDRRAVTDRDPAPVLSHLPREHVAPPGVLPQSRRRPGRDRAGA